MKVVCILYIVSVILVLVDCSNYDAYMAQMALRNQELHELFRRRYPSGAYILDELIPSQEFRSVHPILSEYESAENVHDRSSAEDGSWERLLDSLDYAHKVAEHADLQDTAKRFQTWLEEQKERLPPGNDTPVRAFFYPAYAGSEFAPQDSLWGIHKVSGGSSEVGTWMDYAVFGAQAQEEDEDEDGDNGVPMAPAATAVSDVKLDQLPAYCDPPNPCPLGYDPATLATSCDMDVVNTAEFNRNWIFRKMRDQECSCDEEHMNSCPSPSTKRKPHFGGLRKRPYAGILEYENPYLRGQKRSDVVAKKNHHKALHKTVTVHRNPNERGELLKNIVKKSRPRYVAA